MQKNNNLNIVTDPEFSGIIPPIPSRDFDLLEQQVLRDGCTDPLIVWKGHDILIDGHNRKKICDQYGLTYDIRELEFNSREEVADWIDIRQLGRRNLTPDQMSLLRGRRYNRQKHQGKRNDLTSPNNEDKSKTSEILAKAHGVSKATVERDGQFHDATRVLDIQDEVKNNEINAPRGLIIREARQLGKNPSDKDLQTAKERVTAHVSRNSGDNEWYTPKDYISLAREVMGEIDLDPASCADANKVVKAITYYSQNENGLEQPWHGRVFMNPPYSQPHIQKFSDKLVHHVLTGDISQAVVLVNNATETRWGQHLLRNAAAVCFPASRIKFWHPAKISAPLQGQMILYFGDRPGFFGEVFNDTGVVCYGE